MSYSGSGDVTAPLAKPSGSPLGCAAADFAGFPAGAIALVQRGACTFRSKTDDVARFVYDGDDSTGTGTAGPPGSDVIESVFYGLFESQGLPAEPSPLNGRSDYGPFIGVGIPAGGLFTGAEGVKTAAQAAAYGGTAGIAFDPCYHAACDTYDDVALDTMSDAIAHAVITFAQSTELVNGVRGKGNANRPALGEDDGAGTGGGGSLHDDHEEEAA